jgi:menaquinone-specific isochorismate synthase
MTALSVAARLTARTREIDLPLALVDAMAADGYAWLVDGTGFVTAGTALRVRAEEAADALASIDSDDPLGWPGTGPLALGALPYDDPGARDLLVPKRVIGVTADGRGWITEIGGAVARAEPVAEAPGRFSVAATCSRATWRNRVQATLAAIEQEQLQKAVLAREVLVDADVPFDARVVVDRLRRTQGGCFVFTSGGFVGATPELLVRRDGVDVVARPMAGTTPRGATIAGDKRAAEDLARSTKNGWEHRLVVDAVTAGLCGAGVALDPVGPPEVATLGTVLHLATTVRGHLSDSGGPSALELALALHPTPAIGGAPRAAADAWLREVEGLDRRFYGGPVGWVDRAGNGEWAVALRCAELDGCRARLLAGAGIVAGSDPDAEWAETQAKFAPMLSALVQL